MGLVALRVAISPQFFVRGARGPAAECRDHAKTEVATRTHRLSLVAHWGSEDRCGWDASFARDALVSIVAGCPSGSARVPAERLAAELPTGGVSGSGRSRRRSSPPHGRESELGAWDDCRVSSDASHLASMEVPAFVARHQYEKA
jgi:hypothetical protein